MEPRLEQGKLKAPKGVKPEDSGQSQGLSLWYQRKTIPAAKGSKAYCKNFCAKGHWERINVSTNTSLKKTEQNGEAQKLTYVFMKRKYNSTTMEISRPTSQFSCILRNLITKSPEHDFDEAWNPRNQDFSGPSEVFLDFGNNYQHRTSLLYHLLNEKRAQEASDVQPRKHQKLSPKADGPQSLSPCAGVKMMVPLKEGKKTNCHHYQ